MALHLALQMYIMALHMYICTYICTMALQNWHYNANAVSTLILSFPIPLEIPLRFALHQHSSCH